MLLKSVLRSLPRATLRSSSSLPRRWASSHAQPKGSDTPWMAGSAAVFGSMTAYLLMKGDSHVQHAVHEGTTTHPKDAEEAAPAEEKAPEKPEPEATPEVKSIERSLKTDAPAQALEAESSGEDQATEPVTPQTEESAPEVPIKEEPTPEISESENSGSEKEPAVSEEDVKKSIELAEETGVPKVAMEAEK